MNDSPAATQAGTVPHCMPGNVTPTRNASGRLGLRSQSSLSGCPRRKMTPGNGSACDQRSGGQQISANFGVA
jgi:hypothetical protein